MQLNFAIHCLSVGQSTDLNLAQRDDEILQLSMHSDIKRGMANIKHIMANIKRMIADEGVVEDARRSLGTKTNFFS